MCGKTFRFMELKFLEKALIQGTFTHVSLHSKLVPMSLSLRSRQKEITHFRRQNSFDNLFPQQRKGGGRNYDFFIKIQSENVKITWNIIFFIFCLICSFSKRDGFTVL